MQIRVNPWFKDFALDIDRGPLTWRQRLSAHPTGGRFAAASTTANVDLIFPPSIRLTRAWISLITVFAGGSVSAATLSIGTTGSPATYLGATNVFTGATAGGAVTLAAGAGLGNFLGGNATPQAQGTVRIQLLTTTANANTLTTGDVDIFLELFANSIRIT
jgi:hypothetical protein